MQDLDVDSSYLDSVCFNSMCGCVSKSNHGETRRDHKMARLLDLGLQKRGARKTGHASITVQCQNGRRKCLIDKKQREKVKGIVRSKSRLVSHYGRKQRTSKTEDLHVDQMRPCKAGMVRGKSRLVSSFTRTKQRIAKAEALRADQERPNKAGIVRSKSKSEGHYKGRKQVVAKAETLHADCESLHKLEIGKPKNTMECRAKHRRSESDESSIVDEQQKIGMRDIRLDPNDITNKRLVDDIPTTEIKRQDTQVSKNAQFRAIRPSPTILSHINDNLLGRRRLTELKDAGYNIKLSAPLDNIPFSNNAERERIEENVFRNKLKFFAAAKVASSFPLADLPEIAFAGRSNVGKSSLLNALTRQWGVVRTSDKPGLTQTINFFKLGSKLCLVDLPGYGFAYAKEEVKESWEDLVKEYVTTRVGLKRVCVLVDTKWGMKPGDRELINLMERSQTQYQIVLTKTDTVFPMDVTRRAMQIQETLTKNKSVVQPMIMVSSKSGAGIRNMRAILAKLSRIARV